MSFLMLIVTFWIIYLVGHCTKYAKVTLRTDNGELYRSERAGFFYKENIKCSEDINECFVVCKDYRSCISNIFCNNINKCNIKCDGTESCTNETTIINENNNYLFIHCNGINSCSNGFVLKISNIVNKLVIECNGNMSCNNINLFQIQNIFLYSNEDIIIECNGYKSCNNILYKFSKIITSNQHKINII
eukprot:296132_1